MLYALPDHQVMESLLPALRDAYIEPSAARQRLAETPGLVPIAIRPDESGTIYFADIGDEPFLDWKYVYTVERLIRDGKITRFFATDLRILDGPPAVSDGFAPDGLVFHVSRCGSTLFCKALSRLSTNLVINQGGPLQSGFWSAITNGWNKPLAATEQNLNRLRNLVLMMTRRRQRDYRRCFVKFISWNTVHIDFIRAAFPDSRALYLYRDPAEVLSLVLEETTAALHLRQTPLAPVLTGLDAGDIGGLDDVAFLAHCYASYFRAVAEQGDDSGLKLVNFRNTSRRELFPEILERGLDWCPDADQLRTMQAQYDFYSKDDSDQTAYQGEAEDLRSRLGRDRCRQIDAITRQSYHALENAGNNLFQSD